MTNQYVKKWAEDYDAKLRATDPRFNGCVVVTNRETGAFYFFESAFAVQMIDDKVNKWQIVFTEHDQFHIFDAQTEVKCYRQCVEIENPEWEDK